jgi:hypothetical protein
MLRYHLCGSPEEILDTLTSGKQGSKLSNVTEQIEVMVIFFHLDNSV